MKILPLINQRSRLIDRGNKKKTRQKNLELLTKNHTEQRTYLCTIVA